MVEISSSIERAIAVIVVTIVLLYMTNPIVSAVDAVDTSNWTFTGYEGAIAILGLVPFLWVACVLGFAAYAMFRIAKNEG